MSLFPTVYRSTDPGAPALTGQVGSLVALLDAVLVDGYGVGADAKPGAGWSRTFSATNKRVYRPNLVSSTGYHVRVDDTATTGNARYAWMRGYELMSDIDTGINPVPTVAQSSTGALVAKSTTLDAVSRPWTIIANERFAYLILNVNSGGGAFVHFFGDMLSYKPGDLHSFVMTHWTGTTAWTGTVQASTAWWYGMTAVASSSTPFIYVGRSHTGVVGASGLTAVTSTGNGGGLGGASGPAYPDVVSGGLWYEPAILSASALVMRGELPGLVLPVSKVLYDNDTIVENVDGFPGERFLALRYHYNQLASTSNSVLSQLLFRLDVEWK